MKKWCFLSIMAMACFAGCRSTILEDPSTSIMYTVPQTSHVRMEIENSYNTVIAVPIDADQAGGLTYRVNFDSSSWLDGVYYYTIEYKGINSSYYYKTTKTMLLVK